MVAIEKDVATPAITKAENPIMTVCATHKISLPS